MRWKRSSSIIERWCSENNTCILFQQKIFQHEFAEKVSPSLKLCVLCIKRQILLALICFMDTWRVAFGKTNDLYTKNKPHRLALHLLGAIMKQRGAVVVCKKKKKLSAKNASICKESKVNAKVRSWRFEKLFFSPPQAYWLDLQGRWMEGKKPEFHLIFLPSPDRSA